MKTNGSKQPNKVVRFLKRLLNNKIFWICFGVLAFAGIIAWMTIAPGDPVGSKSALTVSYAVARFLGLFLIIALGMLLGRIKIKGVSFGTAGVFLVALALGAAFAVPSIKDVPFFGDFRLEVEDVKVYSDALGNLGLALFAGAVGYIAGPTFFKSFKNNAKCYITMGIFVTLIGVLITAIIGVLPIVPDGNGRYFAAGIFSGAITSTPALAAAQEAAYIQGADAAKALVTIGYAITYPLGVLGVVLFIQLMPKILHANMSEERGRIIIQALKQEKRDEEIKEKRNADDFNKKELFEIDSFGIAPFAIAVNLGLLIGAISIPLTSKGYNGPCFSLGTTGGCLLSCIIFGHLAHIGRMSFKVPESTNKTFREFGLAVFLTGIGISGGYEIVTNATSPHAALQITSTMIILGIILGLFVTLIPMILGFLIGKYLFKLPLLNNLGSITGSMTSTPALGALIGMSKTDDVAIAYASAFPIATILTAIGMNFYIALSAI